MTTIMVIDDQPTNRRILAELAASVEVDIEVAAFGDPLEALAYAEINPPDLVITDYKMRSIDGDEFIRRFRNIQACQEVPTVVVTAYQDIDFRDRAIEAGSTDFLSSPIDHQEFRDRSRTLLSLRRQRKALADQVAEEFIADITAAREASDAQIQMVGEMLQTVNSRLVETIADLDDAQNDLLNLAEITQVAAVFVDSTLRVRRFTKPVRDIYPLTQEDIGQPLTMIDADLLYQELGSDFRSVSDTQEAIERYVSNSGGTKHYMMRILPYRRQDASIDGAAITFTQVGKWHSGSN